jgi:NAD(P)-dependent dehydrogenase (short-subunit alcohol dehydrogenase family)
MTDDQWESGLAVNLLAPIHFTRLLLRTLLRQPERTSSMFPACTACLPREKPRRITPPNSGLVGLTESLRAEYGRQGIGVTTVCPGFVTSNSSRLEQGRTRTARFATHRPGLA